MLCSKLVIHDVCYMLAIAKSNVKHLCSWFANTFHFYGISLEYY